MTAIIKATKDHAALMAEIEAVERHEKKSKTMIAGVALEVLAHVVEHGQIAPVNKLVKVVTPANRLAIVQLVQDCTLHVWDSKAVEFKGKSKTGNQSEKDLNLTNFMQVHKGDLWAWYETEKAKDNETPKFNAASLAKIIASYAASNNGSFEGLDGEITKAKEVAEKTIEQMPLIEAKTAELIAAGLSAADAKKQAQKMSKEGKLKAPETAPAAAAAA